MRSSVAAASAGSPSSSSSEASFLSAVGIVPADFLVGRQHRGGGRLVALGHVGFGQELVGVGGVDVLGIQAAHFFAFLEHLVVVLVLDQLDQILELRPPLVEVRDGRADVSCPARPGTARRTPPAPGPGPARITSGVVLSCGERVHHVEQLVRAPALLDVVADAARLIVGHDHLLGILGTDEPAIELARPAAASCP